MKADVPGDVIEAARLGQAGAGDRLIVQAWPHAFRIARSILRDRELAEDAAQEACAIVSLKVRSLRSAFAFRVWFYRIVVREAVRLDRKRALLALFTMETVSYAAIGDSILRLDVLHALGKLSRIQRTAVVLHFYADMNSREIAAVLRVPDSTVRFHLARAKRRLESLLGDHRVSFRLTEAVSNAV